MHSYNMLFIEYNRKNNNIKNEYIQPDYIWKLDILEFIQLYSVLTEIWEINMKPFPYKYICILYTLVIYKLNFLVYNYIYMDE